MFNYLMTLILIILVACIIQSPQPVDKEAYPALFPEIQVSEDSVKNDNTTIAYTAVDRQCGSCHHGDRSTHAGALTIFNLKDTCWYCELTSEQCESLKGRISGTGFSDEERSAIIAVIPHLAADDSATH